MTRTYHQRRRRQTPSKRQMSVSGAVVLLVILIVWLRWIAPWPLDWFVSLIAFDGSDDTPAAIVEMPATREPAATTLTASNILPENECRDPYLAEVRPGCFVYSKGGGNQSGQRLAVPSSAGMT